MQSFAACLLHPAYLLLAQGGTDIATPQLGNLFERRAINKVVLGVFWGLATWLVLTFLWGSIASMTQTPTQLSSNVRNLILLPPSLLLAIVSVFKGQAHLIKRSLISILLALALWFVLAILVAIVTCPHERVYLLS